MNLEKLIRPSIFRLKPYSCARDEYKGEASAYLDANENPMNGPYNRYPDPLQVGLKKQISRIKNVPESSIFLGNGSDEPIDLIVRIFCEPTVDNIVAIDPTYGMYQVCADINHVEYRKVLLNSNFSLDAKRLLDATDANTKVIFLCSPNNPTGNDLEMNEMLKVLDSFNGIVVVDEAYIDFSTRSSLTNLLDKYSNLIVLQTFSKAWGMAAVRLGMAFAAPEIISYFNKVKYPYNINILTQKFVSESLEDQNRKNEWVQIILKERAFLIGELQKLPLIQKIYPTDSNFILVQVEDANAVYRYLTEKGIIVRNRNSVSLCVGCLRITVGIPEENRLLMEALKTYKA